MTTPRETGVKRRVKEPPAGDAFLSSSIETFRQRADAVLVSIDDVMRGEDPGRFEEARARAAQALEQYEKALNEIENATGTSTLQNKIAREALEEKK